jgi:formate hydrogenlyase subunit 3/multisubunit Na+/H+ antiporter MnhD subunit
MNAPVLWIFLPALVSTILIITPQERIRFLIFITTSILLVLSTFIIRIDPVGDLSFFEFAMSSELRILGRSFILTEEDKFLVQIVYFFNVIWGIFSYFFRRNSRVVPFGLLFSGMLLAAYTVTPFLYAALIIELSILLSIPLLHDNKQAETQGISRFLIYQTLALPFILLAGWFLAGGEITPVNPAQLVQATLLLGLGFILWLGVFPFHSWISLLYRESETINLGYFLQLFIFIAFFIILKFLNGFSWLRQYGTFFQGLLVLGAIMEGLGALGISFQNNLKDINGYALLHMIGVLMTALGIYIFGGIILFPHMFAVYFASLSLLHITIEYLFGSVRNEKLELAQKEDVNIYAFFGYAYALLTISGMPLTIGFAPVLWMYQILANNHVFAFWVLIGSKILISITAIRVIKLMYEKAVTRQALLPEKIKDWGMVVFFVLVMLAGLFPTVIYRNFEQLLSGFKNLIQ